MFFSEIEKIPVSSSNFLNTQLATVLSALLAKFYGQNFVLPETGFEEFKLQFRFNPRNSNSNLTYSNPVCDGTKFCP